MLDLSGFQSSLFLSDWRSDGLIMLCPVMKCLGLEVMGSLARCHPVKHLPNPHASSMASWNVYVVSSPGSSLDLSWSTQVLPRGTLTSWRSPRETSLSDPVPGNTLTQLCLNSEGLSLGRKDLDSSRRASKDQCVQVIVCGQQEGALQGMSHLGKGFGVWPQHQFQHEL